MTSVLMGPFASQSLGDMGADVVKIEAPLGDLVRQIGPARHPEMGPIFLNTNRNKRSVAVDLKKPAGLAVVRRLLADADVLIYNVRPNAMARLGLDYDDRRGDQPARRLRRPVRLRPGRPVCGATGVRRPDPGRRDAAAPDLGGEQGAAALCAVRDGRPHRRPDGGRRHPRGAAGARAHRPRPAPRRADVRDHGRLRPRRPPRRPQLRPAARRRRLRAPALARAAPLPHERRLHLRAGLQRQAVAGLPARHRPRVAAAGGRALRDLRQPLAQHRLRLRRAGADLRAAQHRRMDGAARGGRRADDADARPEERARRPAPRRDGLLHDQRASDRGPGPLDADADDVFRKHARGGAPRAPPRRAQRRGADAGRLQRRGDRCLDRPGRRPDLERGASPGRGSA